MSDFRDVAAWTENCLTVSTIVTPDGNAKVMNNEVELAGAMLRAAAHEHAQARARHTA